MQLVTTIFLKLIDGEYVNQRYLIIMIDLIHEDNCL